MDKPFVIFVVEDNEWYNKLLVHNLSLNPDFTIKAFHSGKEMLDHLHENPKVITLDYRLPDLNGDELLKRIKDINPSIEVIIISEQSEITTAVDLLKMGAYDYIVKSDDIRDRLLNVMNHIRKNDGLKKEIEVLKDEVQRKYDFENTILGQSSAIKSIHNLVSKATQTNITVSIWL